MAYPLMPKATAVWLVDSTSLTFHQIAEFCGLHPLEVQGIADGEVAVGIVGLDPVVNGQLTREEIVACETDPSARLKLAVSDVPAPLVRGKGPRYTPVVKRQDRPNAISWLLKFHPELTDGQIAKLIGTTKPTINSIRERTHWNIINIKLEDPVSLGMSTQLELDTAVTKAKARVQAREAREASAARKAAAEAAAKADAAAVDAKTAPQPAGTAAKADVATPSAADPHTVFAPAPDADPPARDSEPAAPTPPATEEAAPADVDPDRPADIPTGT